jgi:Leucine-rich repeat (LRR) protein
LDLSGNGLGSVPEFLGDLTALTTLDLGGNKLTTLPAKDKLLTSNDRV